MYRRRREEAKTERKGAVGAEAPVTEARAAEWAEQVMGVRLDEGQRRVLESAKKRVILNCCRQWGKSTVAAAGTAWRMAVRPGTVAVLAGPTLRQAEMLLRKVAGCLERAGWKTKPAGGSAKGVRLGNGSMAVALPGTESPYR